MQILKEEKIDNWLEWVKKLLSGVAIAVLAAGIIWGASSLSEVKIQLAVMNEKLTHQEAREALIIRTVDLNIDKISKLETRVSILESKSK